MIFTTILICVEREVTLFGVKSTRSTISRSVAGTLVTGIEVSPFGSLIAPAGRLDFVTFAVGADMAEFWPSLFLAVTRTRSVLFSSVSRTMYVLLSASPPGMSTQLLPAALQRRQRYV